MQHCLCELKSVQLMIKIQVVHLEIVEVDLLVLGQVLVSDIDEVTSVLKDVSAGDTLVTYCNSKLHISRKAIQYSLSILDLLRFVEEVVSVRAD